MSIEVPENLDEWKQYIQRLPPGDVYEKARAANTMRFVEILKEEGYSAEEIDKILFRFAKRLHEEDRFIPGSGGTQYLNLRTLLRDHGIEVE